MPNVQVFCSPKGFPSTIAQSPVFNVSEEPSSISGKAAFGASFNFKTARSITSSISRTSHGIGAPRPAKDTVTLSAPSTTCAFVSIKPFLPSTQKPEPCPRTLRSCCCLSGRMPKKNEKRSELSIAGISTFCSISTRTTAGPQCSTTWFTKLSRMLLGFVDAASFGSVERGMPWIGAVPLVTWASCSTAKPIPDSLVSASYPACVGCVARQ
mmetsp:Transcript_60246/g.111704  ORF Transcript_60246/g.111704 Transcript_60246/m.111704 type:complete len:211 (+) Transcript_60246:661-1293(+)